MTSPSEKLAESLDILHEIQEKGLVAIRSKDMTRTHRERLIRSGFLQEVIKGWYIPSHPNDVAGDSTSWYTSYWDFCSSYLKSRFDNNWCLSPEQSTSLHAQNWAIPHQLLVRSPKAQNNVTNLMYGTSIFDLRSSLPNDKDILIKRELRILSLPMALIGCSANYFKQNTIDLSVALSLIRDSSEILEPLLAGGHAVIAGRLAGAFRNIGRENIANEIISTMTKAGYDIREIDPFINKTTNIFSNRIASPYANRIMIMWQEMRDIVIDEFPRSPGLPKNTNLYLKKVEDVYVTDAYHSLSIEGYKVSRELIERVRSGNWDPENTDSEHRDALAARGYWQAYQAVRKSVSQVLAGKNAGEIAKTDHRTWYQEMFEPGVTAGILKLSDLAGYRNAPVYIRRSMHVPPSNDAVLDAMPILFDLLKNEPEASVRIVLGHFIFVYIHPYMDGNGRIGRFLMNLMAASGGYPWIVVPLEKRNVYMSSLESASVDRNILPFTNFIAEIMRAFT